MKTAAQKQAGELLETVRVDGRPPVERAQLAAALELLEAEIAAALLAAKWADARVPVSRGSLTQTLSELDDNGKKLVDIDRLAAARAHAATVVAQAGLAIDMSTVGNFWAVLDLVAGAQRCLALEHARSQVSRLQETVGVWASQPDSCPELVQLVTAIEQRDVEAYNHGLTAVETARTEQEEELRLGSLVRTLRSVHPQLADLLATTAADREWDIRIPDLPAAWAWSKAEQFVRTWRNADEERRLVVEFDQVEDHIRRVTQRLAAAMRSMPACRG